MDELKQLQKENRALRKHLDNLTKHICVHIYNIDTIFKAPIDERAQEKIAKSINALDLANDQVMHFGLDYTFTKINKRKKCKG